MHKPYSSPGPPSSQSPSEAWVHSLLQPGVTGIGGGFGGRVPRSPQSKQSMPMPQMPYSAPGPPSSQSPSDAWMQFSLQPGVMGTGGGEGGRMPRSPQSKQSLPSAQRPYSSPAPPSSQSVSEACTHSLLQPGLPGGCGGGGAGPCDTGRRPQSKQSVPHAQFSYSEPSPPSSHSPLSASQQVS